MVENKICDDVNEIYDSGITCYTYDDLNQMIVFRNDNGFYFENERSYDIETYYDELQMAVAGAYWKFIK